MLKKLFNRTSLLLMGLVLLFLFQNYLQDKISPVQYWDELFALAAVPLFLLRARKQPSLLHPGQEERRFLICVAVFWCWGWMGYLFHHYQVFGNAAKDAYASLKFFLSTGTAYLLFDRKGNDFKAQKQTLWLFWNVLSVVLAILCLADRIFCIWYTELRMGLPAIQLFYSTPSTLLSMCVFLGAIGIYFYEDYGRKILLPLGCITWVIYNTRRVKSMGAIGCLVLVYVLIYHRHAVNKWMKAIVGGVVAVGSLSLIYQLVRYFRLGLTTARAVLTISSPFVAWDHFPFGTGWGSYASFFSAEPYSQLYLDYHMDHIWGMSPDFHDFIADTFWPMFLGECGFIGFIAYLAVLYLFFRRLLRIFRPNRPAYASALVLLVYLLFSSTSESAILNPMTMPFAFWLGYLAAECKTHIGKEQEALLP